MATKKPERLLTSQEVRWRQVEDQAKEIAALRKSLRWAMSWTKLSELGRCVHCVEPYTGSKLFHDRKCPYAVARKLAGLAVKVNDA